ncbi:hypothetical protein GCM10009624_11920 [Gordonia sinesedis]
MTLAQAVKLAVLTVGGESLAAVTAEARSRISPGLWCDIYRLPPDERFVTSVAEIESTESVYNLLWYTYASGTTSEAIGEAEQEVGVKIPSRWSEYMTSQSVLEVASPPSGEFLDIYSPASLVGVTKAFYEWTPPIGAVMIGGSGYGSEWLQLDTRVGNRSPVVLLCSGGQEWTDTIIQAPTIDEFIDRVESGRFELSLDGPYYQPDS